MNTGDMIQIEVPDFDPDIDEALPISTDQSINHQETQGSVTSIQKFAEKTVECRTHQKPKRQMKLIHTKTLTITITMPQVRVEAADPIMVKVETDNFKGSYNEIEAKDLSIVNISLKIIIIREAHHNKIVLITATVVSPISRGIMLTLIEAEAVAVDLSNSEDAVVVRPTIRITMEHISISIIHMTNNQNNMVLPAVYAVDLTIPPSTATRVNMT